MADLVPHEGRLFLDWREDDQTWRLTHQDTQESAALPHGQWALALDQEGFAYLIDDDDPLQTEVDVDKYLDDRLAKSDDGKYLVFHRAGPGLGDGLFFYLDTKAREASIEVFVVNAGPTQAPHELQAAVFARPRSGFVIFWSLVSIYRALNFNMFGGTASRWAWQCMPSFGRAVSAHIPGQVLRSQEYGAGGEGSSTDGDRCLPFHCISTVAWVMLLCRWAGASARNGGMRTTTHREAALAFLQALVRAGCSCAESPLVVLVDDGFEWQWPRPLVGSHALELPVEDSRLVGVVGRSSRTCR